MTNRELGSRAVACKHWRWVPGMLPLVVDEDGDCVACDRVWKTQGGKLVFPRGATPDLTDPATLGALLALVREAWEPHRGSDYIASTMHTGSGWGVGARYGSEGLAAIVLPTYKTEAEALVAALVTAP